MVIRSNVSFEHTVGEYTVQMIVPVGIKFETVYGALEGFSASLKEMETQSAQQNKQAEAPPVTDDSPTAELD